MPFEERREALMTSMNGVEKHLIPLASSRSTVLGAISATSSLPPSPSADLVHSANDIPSASRTNISPTTPGHWTVESLVDSSSNFSHVPRISATLPPTVFLAEVRGHEKTGVPLVIDDWHLRPDWDNELFSMESFVGDQTQIVDVRDIRTSRDIKMPLGELAHHYEALMKLDQLKDPSYYGKDIPCPAKWEDWLRFNLPSHFHPCGVNDMISCLPLKDRAETLMCYMGIGDTFTPAHKDPCGSFGHNLMCYTTDGGSAFWFMSATGPLQKDEPAAYFHDKLGVELDLENHRATVEEFRAAPFRVYVTEQRLGDLVLVPPRSCHQVVNKGGITIKMSWSRMGLESFQYSLRAELALYHRVCRPETYRVKQTVFFAVKEYTQRLIDMKPSASAFSEVTTTLTRLLFFLNGILVEEWSPEHKTLQHLSASRAHEFHSCDFCGADIFQSFFACSECSGGDYGSEFICCPSCYIEGRSCICGARSMEPHQSWRFDDLLVDLNNAADALNKHRPPEKRIPQFSSTTMQSSSHLQTFYAACMLRDRILRQTNNRNIVGARCITCSEHSPSQYTEPSFVLHCSVCDFDLCFLHILEMYNVYVAEALLASAQDADPVAWHTMHTSNPRTERGEEQSLAECMAWAAATYQMCRPLDLKLRAKKGFYDKLEQGEFHPVVRSVQMRFTTKQRSKATSSPITTRKITTINSKSPLTELSDLPSENMTEDESDNSEDDSDDDFLPVRPKQASPKKRASERAVEPGDQVPLAVGIRPNHYNIPYVSIPPGGEKRTLVFDSNVSPKPSKRVKLEKVGPPRRKVPKPLEAPSHTHECAPTGRRDAPTSTVLSVSPAPRSRTIVPVGSPLTVKRMSNCVRERPFVSAQGSRSPRYGKPLRSVKCEVARPSRVALSKSASSVSTVVPASSTSSTQAAAASINAPSLDSINPALTSTNLQKEQAMSIELQKVQARNIELQKLYEKSMLSESTLRLRVAALTADNTDRRAAEMRADIARLTRQLAEVREENEACQQQEQEHLLEIKHLRRENATVIEKLESSDRQIANLMEQSRRSQACSAGRDYNFGGRVHMADNMNRSAFTQGPTSLSKDVQLQRVGPRTSSYDPDVETQSTSNGTYHQPHSRPTVYLPWHVRGRGSGRHFIGPSHNEHHERPYAFNAAQFRQSHGPERHYIEHHGSENGRGGRQHGRYGIEDVLPRRGRYGGHQRESYVAGREREHDSQHERPGGGKLSRGHDIAVHSQRSSSPVFPRVPGQSSEVEAIPDRLEVAGCNDRRMQWSSLDGATKYPHSGSPPPRQHDMDIREGHGPRSRQKDYQIEVGPSLEGYMEHQHPEDGEH